MSEQKALLPYGTSPSFPAIEMNCTFEWDNHLAGKARNTITARAEEIKNDYQELSDLAKDTEYVNSIEKRYDVQVGRSYWVYENKQGLLFLSMIEPHEWNDTAIRPTAYHGEFIISPDGTWKRQHA